MTVSVLVVDDAESNRFIFSSWLRRAGYEVLEAATGTEGMAIVAARPVDLVLLDVNLPDMSGFDVCAWIKGRPDTEAVPVIHASATATAVADRSAGLNGGADVYMVEPIERDELLAQVTALLRYSQARRQTERLAGRLAALHRATLEVHGASDLSRLLAALAHGSADIAGCDVAVIVAAENRGFGAMAAADGSEATVRSYGAAEVVAAAAGSAMGLDRLRHAGLRVPHDATCTPIRSRSGRTLGALFVAPPDDEALPVLVQLALAASVAVENLRILEVEHSIALTLQRSLLPASLPVVPGIQVAARYEASSDLVEVGGDFFEVLELSDGHVAVAIGDVQGHNLHAATVMAELRNALRAYLLEGHGPRAVLARLDALLTRFHPDLTATVTCATITPDRSRMVIANAGHIPGVLRSGGTTAFCEVDGTLLGFPGTHDEVEVALAPGALYVLATDGLVERRAGGLTPGLEELRALVADGGDDLDALCDRILADIGPGVAAQDDIALLAIRINP